jgi:hypothetical protein
MDLMATLLKMAPSHITSDSAAGIRGIKPWRRPCEKSFLRRAACRLAFGNPGI